MMVHNTQWDSQYDLIHQKRYQILVDEIEKILFSFQEKEIIIIDIGSGTGKVLELIKDKCNKCKGKKVKIFALDITNVLNDKTIDFIQIDDLNTEHINLPNGFADIIICSEVIEHLYQVDNLLSEAKRILKTEGYFIATTPNLNNWINRVFFLLGYFPFGMSLCKEAERQGIRDFKYIKKKPRVLENDYDYHVRTYGVKPLKVIFKLYNFNIIKTSAFVGYCPNNRIGRKIINFIYQLFAIILPSLSQNLLIICKNEINTKN
ncbi:MAG: class I SAM-dependent methyltransferase [Candidatus Pacebacteria bacterium]|nr:class I SAM-dependent methyltransferase [Candidatus Paceibacterota bacterium]